MNKFAERLKELRTEAGLSYEQLGKEIGISGVAIWYWETNKRTPKIDAVIILARYFKVTLDYIAGLED